MFRTTINIQSCTETIKVGLRSVYNWIKRKNFDGMSTLQQISSALNIYGYL